ncbi:MAG TPA: N-acetyl-gamma-glutamyl-phosphate reductase [Thermoanaerobaculia bacterium]|jgi:N-acetyl-gamma-glutamyl-phosphate reductase|nr:N-acetyl-gamma-glutamyl-phosphate reductase [Thermoanaerobaculia bacterium]
MNRSEGRPSDQGSTVPTLVLGGTGYVAGELLRLLAGHPYLSTFAVLSESQSGGEVEAAFPHLAGCFPGLAFSSREDLPRLIDGRGTLAALCAAPHGAAAPLLDSILTESERAGSAVKIVDISADFRFADAASYEKVYGHAHGAPQRLAEFRCAVPEHLAETPQGHIGHPGCFVTATLLAAVPLLKLGLVEPRLSVVAITGSTGAGRTPTATTHHPARRSNVFAYNPLKHRHEPEMRALASAASGVEAEIHFVPQSGPFARGIYATLQARLLEPLKSEEIRQALAGFYAGAPFVDILSEPPRLQDVAGTNRARLSAAADGDHLVVFSAIDNLVKGAAGGAIQWMNRLLGFPETAGLMMPGVGWL